MILCLFFMLKHAKKYSTSKKKSQHLKQGFTNKIFIDNSSKKIFSIHYLGNCTNAYKWLNLYDFSLLIINFENFMQKLCHNSLLHSKNCLGKLFPLIHFMLCILILLVLVFYNLTCMYHHLACLIILPLIIATLWPIWALEYFIMLYKPFDLLNSYCFKIFKLILNWSKAT